MYGNDTTLFINCHSSFPPNAFLNGIWTPMMLKDALSAPSMSDRCASCQAPNHNTADTGGLFPCRSTTGLCKSRGCAPHATHQLHTHELASSPSPDCFFLRYLVSPDPIQALMIELPGIAVITLCVHQPQRRSSEVSEFKPGLHIHGDLSTHRSRHLKKWDLEAMIGGGHGVEKVRI